MTFGEPAFGVDGVPRDGLFDLRHCLTRCRP